MLPKALRRARKVVVDLLPTPYLVAQARKAEEGKDWLTAERFYRRAAIRGLSHPEYALRLATVLNRQGKNTEGRAWAQVVVDSTLRPSYDAKAALAVHGPYFAERHEMAEFIVTHREEITARTEHSIQSAPAMAVRPRAFVFWDNPERMPEIVRAARRTMREHVMDDVELVELNDATLVDWVRIDPRMRESMRDLPAHFSDYLRLKLLQKYGGYWLDATCYLTADLAPATAWMRDTDMFLYRYSGSRTGSWFMWATPDSYVLNIITAVMETWWEREARLTNYFMLHDIVEMLYWTDSRYRAEWTAMPARHPRPALQLLRSLEKPFDAAEFERICGESHIHKLSHKIASDALTNDTFARHVIARRRPELGQES